ncbi:MAG: ATP-dependent DNA helicase RecG [Candidatus Komeilibacteria bacterium]|nr:ATP-dependent DNA helicase RecG [Candidatus Komeilibacteria bacterium]
MLRFDDSVVKINRLGSKTTEKLKRLHIETVADLLWHLPVRYQDLSVVSPIAKLQTNVPQTVRGVISQLRARRSFRRRMTITELTLKDATGAARAIWFNQGYIAKTLKVGDELYLAGTPEQTLVGMQFTNPIYEKVKSEQLHTARIIPFYNLTEGLTHKQLRFLIHEAFGALPTLPDDLPHDIVSRERLPSLAEAIKTIHLPASQHALERAIRRLKFEELFWMQLAVAYARRFRQEKKAPRLTFKQAAIAEFVRSLPFSLTPEQKKAAWDILRDLEREQPMNRLVQGDVGSGKTVIAAIAMLNASLNGYQSVLMAPTELLAVQHYATLRSLLPGHAMALLTAHHHVQGDVTSTRSSVHAALAQGELEMIVGTHSVIQEGVSAIGAGLVVIDEQHRFGVLQRKQATLLNANGEAPHLLSLTATPIPRTLALTLYGDLDISTIHRKPAGRKPIITRIIAESKRTNAYAFMREKIAQGQQIFILCPLIDDDEGGKKSVVKEHERLQKEVFPDLKLEYVHGKLASERKKRILERFRKNVFPILVATSVIEVGIDIPNATIMVIEGAERFGLAQLHQFRGRVGRNEMQSYCLLFTERESADARKRLELLCAHDDGFALAEADLTLRGEGEVFGTRQSGILNFAIATIHDQELIQKSRNWVDRVISQDTDLSLYRRVRNRLETMDTAHPE